jgi:two-component system, cell cycle response regulator
MWKDIGALQAGPGGNLKITASVGVSSFPSRAVISHEQLIQTADDALYRAKREGRNKICLFQPTAFPNHLAGKTT